MRRGLFGLVEVRAERGREPAEERAAERERKRHPRERYAHAEPAFFG